MGGAKGIDCEANSEVSIWAMIALHLEGSKNVLTGCAIPNVKEELE